MAENNAKSATPRGKAPHYTPENTSMHVLLKLGQNPPLRQPHPKKTPA